MPRYTKEVLLSGIVALLVTGCSSTQSYQTRAYIDTPNRVDQEREGGNRGYLTGKPKADTGDHKKTRQVFVVELSKEEVPGAGAEVKAPAPRRTVIEPAASTVTTPVPAASSRRQAQPIAIPNFDEEKTLSAPAVAATGYTDYTVEKGDTLQKISKKFYNTYRRWNEIFEANKDVMADPNKLKPGMKIKIPGGREEAPEPNLK
jgi:nucleoid-associated protein YgaU